MTFSAPSGRHVDSCLYVICAYLGTCVLCFVSQVFSVYEHSSNNNSDVYLCSKTQSYMVYIYYKLTWLIVTEIDLQKYCYQIWSNMNHTAGKYLFSEASLMKEKQVVLLFYSVSLSRRGWFELICEKIFFSSIWYFDPEPLDLCKTSFLPIFFPLCLSLFFSTF